MGDHLGHARSIRAPAASGAAGGEDWRCVLPSLNSSAPFLDFSVAIQAQAQQQKQQQQYPIIMHPW
uniref:Uncharacterized protein n=1 Tax=Oryza glumipatula TaxID=40148 RepID=A0A0D9Y4H9_9ORYZ